MTCRPVRALRPRPTPWAGAPPGPSRVLKGPPMSAPATIDQFLHLVRESRLVDARSLDAQLERLRGAAAPPDRPRALAEVLRQEGLLTVFQAEQLLLGNCRGFSV